MTPRDPSLPSIHRSVMRTVWLLGIVLGSFLGGPASIAGQQPTVSDREQRILTSDGDSRRGHTLFFEAASAGCSNCHVVEGKGTSIGPDLSAIGGKLDRPHLIESILDPSKNIVEGYRSCVVATVDGRLLSGIIKERSPGKLTLVDVQGRRVEVSTNEVEHQSASTVSLMPSALSTTLTTEQITDLVAYLESLRPREQETPGSGTRGSVWLPDGFEMHVLATGLTAATAFDVAPDGRIFLCEQKGDLRIVRDDTLLDRPFASFPVEADWERGLIGVAAAPGFLERPDVFVCYVAKDPYPHHRLSRLRADGDVISAPEEILFEGDDQRIVGGKVPAGHQGGALHFGPDGKLYVGIGEQTAELPSQRLDRLQGKILRLEPDGSIPADNPFLDQTTGKYRSIWAMGLRNPFTFAFDPYSGRMLINDVGGTFEEINPGRPGANFGWPVVDHGPVSDDRFTGPIHWYPQSSINGGDFAPRVSDWPARYRGRYFFADFVQGWIRCLDPDRPNEVETFARGIRRPVDLRFGPDGSLLVLVRNAWVLDDKLPAHTGSLLRIRPAAAGTSP